jgi:hypothetical protein
MKDKIKTVISRNRLVRKIGGCAAGYYIAGTGTGAAGIGEIRSRSTICTLVPGISMINFVCALLKDFKIIASVLPSMRHFDPISKRIMINTKWFRLKKNYSCLAA